MRVQLRKLVRRYFALLAFLVSFATTAVTISSVSFSADEPQSAETPKLTEEQLRQRGEEIYRAQCASCHGNVGEGVATAHPDPLIGDRTIGELSKIIHDTMPEGEPEKCVGIDAEAVANYIHFAFYSEAAQIRNRPPRVGLSRLTANQLRQSMADLYSHYFNVPAPTDKFGVKGIYFDGARWKKENIKIERVDPVIDFDWGKAGPGEGIKPEAFYVYWEGGIKADVTGRYEIIVRSTCSFTLNFGKQDRELIDNHVQSGDKTEFRANVFLTAGRVYPFKIDFFQRERKTEQPPAKISLSWVKPHGTEEILPVQNFVQGWVPPAYSLQAMLPPDDRSYGYERGISINRPWDESTTAAAIEFAQVATDELWPHYQNRHKDDPNENRAKLRAFLKETVELAFRGPIDAELQKVYIDQHVDATPDDAEAIKRVLLISLKSPRFLYPLADMDRTQSQQTANRLALTMFDSLPSDEWLVRAAREDKLNSEEEIRKAAWRMLNDYRTRGKTRELMHEWLNLGRIEEVSKDQELFKGFTPELASDLRTSLELFVDDVVWSEASDYRQLFKADWSYTSDRIAAYYGDSWKAKDEAGARLRPTAGDANARAGVLTHPYLMSGLAYHNTTSPIHRGIFLIRFMLGRTLRPPNAAFSPFSPDLHPDLTTRERVTLQTIDEACQTCHSKINALGFTLENYDAVGRYRTTERDKPIDPTGSYLARTGEEVKFSGSQELADYLANSDDAHRAFVTRAFQHFVKQPVAAYGNDTLDRLTEKFRNSGFSIRNLIVEIAVVAASQRNEPAKQES